MLTETTSAGWGEGTLAAPQANWRPQRLGADPPPSLATLRTDSAQAVLATCGVSADLFTHGDAAGQRESWRRFLHGSVQPLADLLAVELADKLDAPGLRLGFDRLFASDVMGRARAFQSLTGGGMEAGRAAELAGLTCSDRLRWYSSRMARTIYKIVSFAGTVVFAFEALTFVVQSDPVQMFGTEIDPRVMLTAYRLLAVFFGTWFLSLNYKVAAGLRGRRPTARFRALSDDLERILRSEHHRRFPDWDRREDSDYAIQISRRLDR